MLPKWDQWTKFKFWVISFAPVLYKISTSNYHHSWRYIYRSVKYSHSKWDLWSYILWFEPWRSFEKITRYTYHIWTNVICETRCDFIGNPNFQGLLNKILQTLLDHCNKQHNKYRKLAVYWTKYCYLFLCFLRLFLPLSFSTADVLQFLDTVLSEILNVIRGVA